MKRFCFHVKNQDMIGIIYLKLFRIKKIVNSIDYEIFYLNKKLDEFKIFDDY